MPQLVLCVTNLSPLGDLFHFVFLSHLSGLVVRLSPLSTLISWFTLPKKKKEDSPSRTLPQAIPLSSLPFLLDLVQSGFNNHKYTEKKMPGHFS